MRDERFQEEIIGRMGNLEDASSDLQCTTNETNAIVRKTHKELQELSQKMESPTHGCGCGQCKGSNEAIEAAKRENKTLQLEKAQLQQKNEALRSNSAHRTANCPNCLTNEERILSTVESTSENYCTCTVCGHEFKVDPTQSNIDETAAKWHSDHSAKLWQVGVNRYRIEEMAVSYHGCLVIPNKAKELSLDKVSVTTITYCEPPPCNNIMKNQFNQVKKLFLSKGITLFEDSEYGFPFSDMQNLEKIMVWNDKVNGYVEDKTLLKKIKGSAENEYS